MKKYIVVCIAFLMIGVGTTQTTVTTDAVFSKDEAVKERFAVKRERLAKIVSKKIADVENSIKKKLKEQEVKKEQKEAIKTIEEATNQTVTQEVEKEWSTASEQTDAQAPIEDASQPSDVGADTVSGATASGRERGQKNKEWGERLSDPNLTPEERQGIIQEKKNYNRNNH
ncbi:hypothetical protein [Candidatus Enterococcus ikei]|uniref:Uncharacterized protein n=1 Tax=Candidatus Enterococcus ikei TaxID=2815326 RepID=A0ABS3GXE1_9ENTE|nr:hypothetical protein [Enterococcus sp. DIV0869a]MBO0439933.1 hypothetical protein [Enterococcus sp. DIV0869a]